MSYDDQPVEAKVSADFDAPDRVLYGLTARQVAILAAAGTLLWLVYQALTPAVPAVVVAVAALPIAGVAVAVAVGRRDGISMDRWLAAAVAAARGPAAAGRRRGRRAGRARLGARIAPGRERGRGAGGTVAAARLRHRRARHRRW